MKPIAILYATREGQTRRIAEHVAATLRARSFTVSVANVHALSPTFALADYGAVILAASVHAGRHEREMVAFAKQHRTELETMNAAFLSVSMSEASAERASSSPEMRAQGAKDTREAIEAFFTETGWHPAQVKPIAGALLYREYGFLKRVLMRMIVKKKGGDIDTSRDYEYTDWDALDRFVGELADRLEPINVLESPASRSATSSG
jgi:menaquinone-dependent protoporphyrinogen oxidase